MFKDAVISFFMGAIMSGIITYVVVALIIGEAGIPVDMKSHIISNLATGIMGGGFSGFVSTIIAYKRYKGNPSKEK